MNGRYIDGKYRIYCAHQMTCQPIGLSMSGSSDFEPDPACAEKPDSGEGVLLLHQWYFNVEIAQCRELLYKGSGGSPNRFKTRKECESTCLRQYVEGAEDVGPRIKPQVDHKAGQQKKIFSHRYGVANRRPNSWKMGWSAHLNRGRYRKPYPPLSARYGRGRRKRPLMKNFYDYDDY